LLSEIALSGGPGSGAALRALTEVATNVTSFLHLFQERLTNSATASDAAYALARIGEAGLVPLLRACTNNQVSIRAAGMAGLDPRVRDFLAKKAAVDFYTRSGHFSVIFNFWSIAQLHGSGGLAHLQRMQQAFQQYSTNANASIRSEADAVLRSLEVRQTP
jgi:hypothetical protein